MLLSGGFSLKNIVMNKTVTKLCLLLFALSFLLYANTINHGFVLDDGDLILNNKLVSSGTQSIPEILVTPYRYGTLKKDNDLYRPLSLVMFTAEYELTSGKPMLSHVTNVLLFAICVVALFIFLIELLGESKIAVAFLAAILFAFHPIHTEVVANIKSRDELLCFLFGVCSLLFTILFMKRGNSLYIFGAVLFYFFALFSKETGITLLFIFPLLFLFLKDSKKSKMATVIFSIITTAVLYLLLRQHVLTKYNANHSMNVDFIDNMIVGSATESIKIATSFFILGKYLQLLVFPHPLVCDYTFNSIPFTDFSNWFVLVTIVIYLGLLVFSIYLLVLKNNKSIGFAILWYLSCISLFTNFIFPVGVPMAERFLFFPSVGYCLFASLLLEKRFLKEHNHLWKNYKLIAVILSIITLYGFKTLTRNKDWKDNLTLFEKDIKTQPLNARLAYYYGTELTKNAVTYSDTNTQKKQLQKALINLHRAIEIYPEFELAYVQLASTYFKQKIDDSAIFYNLKALQLNDFNSLTHYNIAGVYFSQKNYEASKKHCLQAIQIKPEWADAYTSLALCYVQMNKTDSCIYNLQYSININPNKRAYELLYMVYDNLGEMDSVKKYKAIAEKSPSFSF